MISPENRRFADDYRNLVSFYREIGRVLTAASADYVMQGVKNAVHTLAPRYVGDPDGMDVALCDETWAKRFADKTKDAEPEPLKKTEKTSK